MRILKQNTKNEAFWQCYYLYIVRAFRRAVSIRNPNSNYNIFIYVGMLFRTFLSLLHSCRGGASATVCTCSVKMFADRPRRVKWKSSGNVVFLILPCWKACSCSVGLILLKERIILKWSITNYLKSWNYLLMDLFLKLTSCVDSLMSNRGCTHVGEATVGFLCQLLNMKKKSTEIYYLFPAESSAIGWQVPKLLRHTLVDGKIKWWMAKTANALSEWGGRGNN